MWELRSCRRGSNCTYEFMCVCIVYRRHILHLERMNVSNIWSLCGRSGFCIVKYPMLSEVVIGENELFSWSSCRKSKVNLEYIYLKLYLLECRLSNELEWCVMFFSEYSTYKPSLYLHLFVGYVRCFIIHVFC